MEGTEKSPSIIINNIAKYFIFIVLSIILVGCGPSFLRKQDYRASIEEMSRGNTEAALASFPKGEEGAFITGMEKGYLNLLSGRTEMDTLKKYALIIDNRLRYKVSREARSLFYAETPEEYYASEHEIVWLHLLLSWGYSIDGEPEKACVEARQSADLLSYTWSEEGHFDDPMLRTFLAGLWAMCGSWEDARVDLRAAAMLDDSLGWTRELAERERPPRYIFLVLGGIGPEVVWDPEFTELNPLRGARQVDFRFKGLKSDLSISDRAGKQVTSHLTPDASGWYERHLYRDNEIHDLIMDSRYGNQIAAGAGKGTGKILTGTATGIAIAAVSLGIGGGLVYLGGVLNSSDLVGYGIGVGILGVGYGYKVATRTYRDSLHQMKRDFDPSGRYRFVRFLPEYLWIGWSDDELSFPIHLSTARSDLYVSSPTVVNDSSIFVLHVPDVPAREDPRKTWMHSLEMAIGEAGWKSLDDVAYDLYRYNEHVLHATSPAGNEYEITGMFDKNMIRITVKRGLMKHDQTIMVDLLERTVIPYTKNISLFLDERPDEFLRFVKRTIRTEITR